ncbi:MAG: hypothetical protein A2725_01870 [Candidatus Magasanikbacteria bacterium RIFCSPHIGHO2_01_FULL_33_34]|uniref:Uncharacterized protein n=1 Tax=Candidatus Magasanikbacteria bacterium RIFCSPHIGHO2_01_FULL_33_34 TaxID=1798671 RepID=A0A1F6LKQ0_9BACT|nr:MAG: hypothetical protein A2725_01870 [Candidatus Magasanikbacteria bacterium RIFCSPHIGHO2_01_FULL_33_34]OGH65718.1 MAG: hypothetical protein A3B83_02375 [Candidatus Magasanikbacteria bacterium RIFCSPHIGHO2_02_FULL_33_17]OGH76331.1 MAG: hypothetical protein A3A89_03200 [Candidatus Magasanikbacteria bacterium RIFCSPLOWO2_01_FULL_33_34]OGH82476.1 MAG: hypothetical protein A3F93_03745 [Candidatus Magasanikbacteria bacterium RIFCSPLOWO2_12_FULL_34_7]
MGKFKKGIFLGGLLGASMVWMSTTKKGKEVKEKLLDGAAEVYVDLKEKIESSEAYAKMTKHDFVNMVRETVDKYAVQNGLADKTKTMMTKLVSAQWSNLQGQLHKKCKCGGKKCEKK